MRLLMTTDTIGGVWTYTQELGAELLARGISVALVSFGRSPSFSQASWVERMRQRYGNAFRYDAADTPLEWMSDNASAYRDGEALLLTVAREFGAEVLHSNQFCFGRLPVDIPKIVAAHSDVLSWAAACRNKALDASAWLAQYRDLASAGIWSADALVAPTRWMLEALAANFQLPARTLVIANGRRVPVPEAGARVKLQAVSAGRLWDEAKNLRLLERVRAPFPILLAGETEHELQSAPKAPGGAVMLGHLEEEDLLALFRESAIYLCTSRYEPFGLAPLEAALCGCAILANDLPSLREVWSDGALFFQDAASLSALLTQLGRYPQRLASARRRSSRRAQRFTVERMANGYMSLYRSASSTQATAHVA